MKCSVWKWCRYLHWLEQASVFDSTIFWAICKQHNHPHCVTDQPSSAQSRRSVLNFVFSSYFSEVDKLLDEHWHWAKKIGREKISTPIHVPCNHIYWSKICGQEFWYILSGLDIQLQKSENDNTARKKWFIWQVIYWFFLMYMDMNWWLSG